MDHKTISFPSAHKKRWGFSAAALLSYIREHEVAGEFVPLRAVDMQEALSLHPTGIVTARDRLKADQVLEVQRVGNRYEYKIDHQRLQQLEKEGN